MAPSLRRVAVGWIAVVSVALVACNLHTPTDVVGGLLAGPLLLAPARAATYRPSTSLTEPRRVRHWMSRTASSQRAVIRRWRERADRGGQ
jgi:membrane-associated phospholipid phosphatase